MADMVPKVVTRKEIGGQLELRGTPGLFCLTLLKQETDPRTTNATLASPI